MSEAASPNTAEHETPPRVEIVHYPNYDIVINNDADKAVLGHQLAELFQKGTPADWERLKIPAEIYPDLDDLDLPFGPRPGMAHGVVDDVDFLLKVKQNSGPEYDSRKAGIEARAEEAVYLTIDSPQFQEGLAAARRLNSILNEIAIAPIVKRLTASLEAQELAQKHGFKSFKYLEPIIGIIDKETGVKSLVYEYIKDAENLGNLLESHPEIFHIDEVLEKFFFDHGIDPGNDFGHNQLLIDPDNNLYLIDLEMGKKISTSPETTS